MVAAYGTDTRGPASGRAAGHVPQARVCRRQPLPAEASPNCSLEKILGRRRHQPPLGCAWSEQPLRRDRTDVSLPMVGPSPSPEVPLARSHPSRPFHRWRWRSLSLIPGQEDVAGARSGCPCACFGSALASPRRRPIRCFLV
eukprot:scaffold237_cov421-Prasinococcus_capsulatus_cf.AAC.10